MARASWEKPSLQFGTRERRLDHLEGNPPPRLVLDRLEHHPHATLAEPTDDAESGDSLGQHCRIVESRLVVVPQRQHIGTVVVERKESPQRRGQLGIFGRDCG